VNSMTRTVYSGPAIASRISPINAPMASTRDPPQTLTNGIVAARVEWMTAAQPADCQPSTPDHPVTLNRVDGILRARRIEATRRAKKWRQRTPVHLDRTHNY